MMNCGTKAAISITKTNVFHRQTTLFHSTPVLDRKRRHFWDASHRSTGYSRRPRRSRRLSAKETLFRNVSAYADHIFQSSQDSFDEEDPTSSSGPSWFRQQYSKGSKNNRTGNQGTRSCGKGFQFCEDGDYFDVNTLFRSTFGGNRIFYWSFSNEETPRWKNSSGYSYNYERNWRYRVEEDYDSSSEFDSDHSESDFASDRLALGLSASGPLKLEDVKHAYRACALKWHPDRHHDSSKAIAEEKFKLCNAAYQSICGKWLQLENCSELL